MNKKLLFAIIVLPLILYLNACFCEFVFDDVSAIQKNKDVTGEQSILELVWNDYWGTSMAHESSHKSYRPLTVLTYRFNHLLFGAEPWSFHLINVVLNVFVCYLVFQLYTVIAKLCFNYSTKEFLKKRYRPNTSKISQENVNFDLTSDHCFISSVATLLFIVHPIHTEAVTGVVGRAELLSSVFFILAILFYVKLTTKSLIFAFLFSTLAVASKEQGITVIAVCAFIDIIIINKLSLDDFCLELVKLVYSPRHSKHKPLLFRIFLNISCCFINLFWRYHVMQGNLPHFTAFDNPAAAASFPSRQLTLNYLLPVNAWLLLLPNGLLCDWTMGTIPLINRFDDVRNLATIVFWFIYFLIGLRVFHHDPVSKILSLSLALATFSFLPASNLFFTVGFVVAERVLFLPSIGFCLLIAVGLWTIKKKYKCERLVFSLILALLLSHATKTIHRNTEWKSELSLFLSGLKVTKQNAKIWNNIGHAYEATKHWEIALSYFIEASKVQPDDLGAHQNVARAYERLGNLSAAEATYRKAKSLLPQPVPGKRYTARVPPSSLKIFVNLAELIKHDRPEEANKLYLEVSQMRPTFVDAYVNRGEILLTLNKPNEALKCYEKALKLPNANISDIYYNMGVVHSHMGNHSGAVEAYTYSIANNPYNVKALFNSAAIFEETREPSLLARAKSRLTRVLALEPSNLFAMSLMGSIYMDLGEFDEAIIWWNKALSIDAKQRTCLFNLALIYSKMDGREDDCISAVKNLLYHYPQHEKGLQLYGDTLMNKKKDPKKAKKIYEQLIDINPMRIEAQHNLCVVMVEERNLKGAEACLLGVYNMAPHLDYVRDNLARVRQQLNLIEIGERAKKESELSNFKKTPVRSTDPTEEDTPEQSAIGQSEEIIYVAQPVNKKHVTPAEEAKKIRDNLKNSKSNNVEENLKTTLEAVKKLKDLQKKVNQKTNEQCSSKSEVKTSILKQSALEILDKLETQLDNTED